MLNGVVTRINNFINRLNAALALLPEWATGEGGVRIGTLDPVELSRIGNPLEGAATATGAAAADAFSAALSRTYLEPPDLGLGAMADNARGRVDAQFALARFKRLRQNCRWLPRRRGVSAGCRS